MSLGPCCFELPFSGQQIEALVQPWLAKSHGPWFAKFLVWDQFSWLVEFLYGMELMLLNANRVFGFRFSL